MKKTRNLLLALALFVGGSLFAQSQRELRELMHNRGEYYFTLSVGNPSEIQAISDLCSVDGTDGRTVVCYANQQQYDKLLQAGYEPNLQTPPSLLEEAKMWDGNRATYAWDSYPTYSQYESMMQAYPSSAVSGRTCSLLTLGTLNSGRKIMGVRINNGSPEGKPKFLYSSTIHGDETTGWILMLRLIDELCTSTESRIVNLVDNLDIFIFPNTNPDGTYYGGNNTVTGARRANANNVDMNRNYPDPHSSAHPDGNAYQTETQWFMQLAEDYAFTMAANYHGGAQVVNYPWDNTSTRHADDAWWQYVSREYANLCHAVSSSYMTDENNGITNGADWYTIGGGRQDYMNGYRQCREVTVECSTTKNPSGSQLPTFWNYNHNSMLAYMEQCLNGVHGMVYDATTDAPLDGVTVTVLNHDDEYSIVSSHEDGDFHRPIKGGTWDFKFTKEGYCAETVSVTVADGQREDVAVYLYPEGSCPVVLDCYEQTLPTAAGDYVLGYLDGSTLRMPTHNNSSTVTATSVEVTATSTGFSVEQGSNVPLVTLTAYGNGGQYYIKYNNRYLSKSNYNTNLSWSSNSSQNSRWYVDTDGIYMTVSSSGGWGGSSTTTYYLYYNNGFRLSTTANNNIHFYVEGDCPMTTYYKDIVGYAGTGDRYYLIASPIGEVNPEDVTDMLSNDYDLYYFDQSSCDGLLEWVNYEGPDGDYNLLAGKGYLYANSEDVTLAFTGYPYEGSGEVTLTKEDFRFSGWNLVGNPFAETANIGNRAFYRMNSNGTEIVPATEASIAPMEGIFVIAEEDGETLTFITGEPEPGKGAMLVLSILRNRGTAIDRAIVRFDNGDLLPKFQLNPNSTKVYIPQNNKDYAVVNAEEDGEMPVNFKAAANGTYTIGVNSQEVDFRYLHLIDNLTGADIDLLATPSYTFEANVADHAYRFRLVFVSGSSANSDTFAFYSNGSWIVDNDGDAVLQVIDVTGRLLSSEQIDGCFSKRINAAPGVYMLRLVNGERVRTQKIVID